MWAVTGMSNRVLEGLKAAVSSVLPGKKEDFTKGSRNPCEILTLVLFSLT